MFCCRGGSERPSGGCRPRNTTSKPHYATRLRRAATVPSDGTTLHRIDKVCDVPQRPAFEQNGITSCTHRAPDTRHAAIRRHTKLQYRQAAHLSLPQTSGEGVVTLQRTAMSADVCAGALIPSNSSTRTERRIAPHQINPTLGTLATNRDRRTDHTAT